MLLELLHTMMNKKAILDWNLTSNVGQTIASGIYLFTAESQTTGNIQVGKFVVVK